MSGIFCNKEFKDIVMKYAEYKATGEGEGFEFLERLEKRYGLESLIEYSFCDKLSAIAVFEETCKHAANSMGRYWSMLLFVGVMCKRMKNVDVATYYLDWLDDNCLIPVLFENYMQLEK